MSLSESAGTIDLPDTAGDALVERARRGDDVAFGLLVQARV